MKLPISKSDTKNIQNFPHNYKMNENKNRAFGRTTLSPTKREKEREKQYWRAINGTRLYLHHNDCAPIWLLRKLTQLEINQKKLPRFVTKKKKNTDETFFNISTSN